MSPPYGRGSGFVQLTLAPSQPVGVDEQPWGREPQGPHLPCPWRIRTDPPSSAAGRAATTPKGPAILLIDLICLTIKPMTHMAPSGSDAQADARERSFRSLVQGLALDVSVAVVLVLATAFTTIEWTPVYWKLLGLTVAKSILQAGASYLMRVLVKPKE